MDRLWTDMIRALSVHFRPVEYCFSTASDLGKIDISLGSEHLRFSNSLSKAATIAQRRECLVCWTGLSPKACVPVLVGLRLHRSGEEASCDFALLEASDLIVQQRGKLDR